jgi:KDO2-lipid IV(A) lauroyltransferase
VIISNLTPLVGEVRAKAMAPKLMGNFLMTAVDFFCAHRDLAASIPFENWSAVDKAYRKTKRVILVTAHLGHWEVGISCLVEKGFSMAGVYAPYREDAIVQWILRHRQSEAEWIPASRGAALACINALERGRVLGMVADIPFGEKGRRVKIAGAYAHLPLGPWAIAVWAKATVIPVFIIRESPGRYRGVMLDPITPPEGSFRHQMEAMQDVYRAHLESYLQRYPEQWGVLQRFWDPKQAAQ